MIRLYILDTGGADAENFYPVDMTPHITETKNKELRSQRIFAHALLSYAYRDTFSASLPQIVYGAHGRPNFKDSARDFNISHAGNMIALIISDRNCVGVDIETVGKGVSERLSKSVFEITENPVFKSRRSGACELFCDKTVFLSIGEDGKIIPSDKDFIYNSSLTDLRSAEDARFKADWTLLEALVKADGRGIGAIKDTAQLLGYASLKSFIVSDTGALLYYLTAVSFDKEKNEESI